jgi:hypothetical protein
MEKDYNQYYTSSLFNIKNNIDISKNTIFINIFTNEDYEIFNEINDKIVIYNNELHFFNYLNIVDKVIQSNITIYSDNIKIRQYLFKNGVNPIFITKKYIQVHKNIDLSLFYNFKISLNETDPLIIQLKENKNIIIDRLKKKLPTIIVDNINILEIEEAIYSQKLLYVENVDKFIKDITFNLYVSKGLEHFKERFKNNYLKKNYNNSETSIFFGMYNKYDINTLEKHNGIKFLIWGGTDCNFNYKNRFKNLKRIIKIPDLYHIAISNDIQKRLNNKNIKSIFLDLNLVDKKLFKPVSKKGNSIFIYNGFKKGKEELYGEIIYKEVVKKLPDFNYIYSNQLQLPYEKMPEIYAKCFIGLRLTEYDGNANTVQEMKAMNIPIVHNLSEYGLKWKNVDDIIKYINMFKINLSLLLI